MLSLFLNPITFVVGAALISAPIIIHLINRIRFRRVKWAAMEFLLKAQKRMRRRKILEQLLLLLMRCLLVFLTALLFGRYLGGCGGGTGSETRPTTHLVILDDTPSMADSWRTEDGTAADSYSAAKKLVYEKLMPAAGEASTAQTFQVVRISELDKPFPANLADGKVSASTIAAMKEHLEDGTKRPLSDRPWAQPGTVRKSVAAALDAARALVGAAPPKDAKVVHVVSDLRAVDWTDDALTENLNQLKELGATVHFIDVAHPTRKPDRMSPAFTDNVAITEVRPRNRVVAVNQQTDIEVRIKNFGATDLKDVRVDFYLNGVKDVIQSMVFQSLPANQERIQTCPATFTQAGSRERPLDRFNLVTAALGTGEAPGAGLLLDNVRHTVVEVRPKLQVLVVDGRVDKRDKQEGDSFYLRKLFLDSFGGIDWVVTEAPKLENYDLRPFSAVYLLNVPALTKPAVENVERFVKGGGGVGVFLGPDVKAKEYNELMHRRNDATGVIEGFFPVPLPDKFTDDLTPEQRETRFAALAQRVILRDPADRTHPALSAIYTNDRGLAVKDQEIKPFFYFTNIDNYWAIPRRGGWRDDKSVRELYCMPNEKPIADFEQRSRDLVAAVKGKWDQPKFEKARKYLDPLLKNIFDTPAMPGQPLTALARYLDQLLCDTINDGDESEPVLRDFWSQPELADVKPVATQLRDDSKYGDPLYLAKQFGRGRVAVMTTDAGGTHQGGKQWTDWPSGKGSPGWVVVVSEMQRYLSGGGGESNPSVGDTFAAEFEAGRYKQEVLRHRITFDPARVSNEPVALVPADLGKQALDGGIAAPGAAPDAPVPPLRLSYSDARIPGAYVFSLTRIKTDRDPPGTPAEQPDYAVAAFNVDAAREGDLRRANTEDFAQITSKAPLHNTEDLSWVDDFKQKPTDLSSRRWLYMLILFLLLAEQAWAVRISYHAKAEDLDALAPSAAAAFAHSTAPPVAEEAAEPVGAGR